jgi:hypothetical protein
MSSIDSPSTTDSRATRFVAAGPRRSTRLLLAAGVVAGPIYVLIALAQALTRPGFDLSRHPWSALANGEHGWIQVANFLVAGGLVLTFAVGLRRVVTEGSGARWVPRLIGAYGVSLIGAGVFRADPVPGFPVGTPVTDSISGHGLAHLMVGALGFCCLTTACLLLARRFARTSRAWALWTAAAGICFLGAFLGIASGAGSRTTIVIFVAAVVIIWTWFTSYAWHLLHHFH